MIPGTALGLEVYSTSFEKGTETPEGWRVENGKGEWSTQGRNGGRCLALTGTGKSSVTWRSPALTLKPNQTYRLTCYLRGQSFDKNPVLSAGLNFCQHDFPISDKWEQKTLILRSPAKFPEGARLYFSFALGGFNGAAYCDDMKLEEVGIRSRTEKDLVLGSDEKIKGGVYTFESHFSSDFSNYCRVEVEHTSGFHGHGNHHVFRKGEYVLHKYAIGSYPQLSGRFDIHIGWYVDGEAVVEASKDGKAWREVGRFSPRGDYRVDLPGDLFPAQAILVRVTGTGTFEVMRFAYTAKLDGSPPDMQGSTVVFTGHYLSADTGKIRLDWSEDQPEMVAVQCGGKRLGELRCVLAQFEKQGLGYKKAGVGLAEATRVKKIELKQQEAQQCAVEVTVEREDSAETQRRFEATYRFEALAGQNWARCRLVSAKNADGIEYQLKGYVHLLQPAVEANAQPFNFEGCGGWVQPDGILGALAEAAPDFTFSLRREGDRARGDVTRSVQAKLSPGYSWQGAEPALVLFAAKGSDRRAIFQEAQQVRVLLAKPVGEAASGAIAYQEEKGESSSTEKKP